MYRDVLELQSYAEWLAEDNYCRSMPITKTSTLSKTQCHTICTATPGYLFFNIKKSEGDTPLLCHYADPLSGSNPGSPDNLQGWEIYLLN